ncbi:OmpA family protein [Aliivibrio fischeri]|uniref:OmpA family protein n=1 Tax=Aliivibrio fischeri TaxID=668 RepID=UPI0007C50E81|nr:OmpA family protein [Aliivibrio fischeri]
MKFSSLSMVIALSLSSSVFAMTETKVEQTGFWLGAALGMSFLDESILAGDTKSINSSSFSSKIEFGYDFNEYVGTYSSYDFTKYRLGEDDLHIGSFGLKGKEFISDTISLYGKLGAAYPFGERNRNGLVAVVGTGLEFQLTHALATKVGLDFYNNLELRRGREADLTQVYWGLSYRFGQPETPLVITKRLEVIKEVPVEVIKEVPVEVIKIKEVVKKEKIVISSATGEKLFANNSSKLESTSSLKGPLEVLKKDPTAKITIIGYTDSRGSITYNQRMSERRAESVAKYFKDNDIDESRIITIGKGEENPVATNATVFGRAQNRRVELSIE